MNSYLSAKYIFILLIFNCLNVHSAAAQVVPKKAVAVSQVGKELLPAIINLPDADEFNPQFDATGNIMYFNRSLYEYNVGGKTDMQDIYVCEMDTMGVIRQVYNAGAPLNNKGANAVVATSGSNLVFLNNEYSGILQKPGLSFSIRDEEGRFRAPKNAGLKKLRALSGYIGFTLDKNQENIIVSMMAKRQLNKKAKGQQSDLYFISKDFDGNWVEPIPLGDAINTAGSEISPWLHPNGKVLFFASNSGTNSQGGYDMYYSIRLDSARWDRWSTPVNLGKKANSPGFDAYFITDPFGMYGYFSSDNGKKNKPADLYRISLEELFKDIPNPGIQVDSGARNYMSRRVIYIRDTIYLKDTVLIVKYAPVDTLQTIKQASKEFYERNDSLVKINPIYFDFNQFLIGNDMQDSLNNVLSLATEDDEIIVFIRAYTDVIGSEEYNKKLSMKRSLAIKQLLEAKGLAPNRIFAIGGGKDRVKKLADESDEAGRAKNRRADIEIRRRKEF